MAIYFASLGNNKARLWIRGRKDIFQNIARKLDHDSPIIWMHCASLGEFEQGRPVLEKIKKTFPAYKILLTFFSPSGYEVRKNYPGADWIFYLPLDTKNNAKKFLDIINPQLAIFVKYEYWYHYLNTLYYRKIPTLLISAIFRENDIFFKKYGILHKKMLGYFTHIFVQSQSSKELLRNIISEEKVTVAGDTRFDRVTEIKESFELITEIEKFISSKPVIVAGSTWPDDELHLQEALRNITKPVTMIIAPHEIHNSHLQFVRKTFPNSIFYSEWKNALQNNHPVPKKDILIIDNIGLLSRLYHYASICYIGGGFNNSGIHNTLEAAVYGNPVIFGPNYTKFAEAIGLIQSGGAYSYNNDKEFTDILNQLLNDPKLLSDAGNAAGNYVRENTGATFTIIQYIKQIVS